MLQCGKAQGCENIPKINEKTNEKTNEEELVPCKGIIYMSVQYGKDFYNPCPHNNKVPVGTKNAGGETCIECSKENSRNYMSRDHISGGRSVAPI